MDKEQAAALKAAEARQAEKLNERALTRVEEIEAVQLRADGEETDDELAKLAETDAEAAEAFAIRLTGRKRGDLAKPYILRALKNNGLSAAHFVEGFTEYGTLDFDRADVIYALAVSEQYYDDDAGKKLFKICNGKDESDISYVQQADVGVFSTALRNSLTVAFAAGQYDKIRFCVERAAKQSPVRDYKNSFILSLYLYGGGDEPLYEDYGLYVFNPRLKKQAESETLLDILELLQSVCAGKTLSDMLKESEIDILGKRYSSVYGERKEDDAAKRAFHAQKGGLKDEEVGIRVSKGESKALNASVCSGCGRPTGGAAVCPYCGCPAEESPSARLDEQGNMVVHIDEALEEKPLTALVCPQCGSPVYVGEDEGQSVVCPACGSSLVLNKKALGMIARGLDYGQMEADKPKGAEIPKLNFIRKSLFSGTLGVIMPDSFSLMDAKMKAIKYPKNNPPQFVFTDESGKTNFTFSVRYGMAATDKDIPEIGRSMLESLRKAMPAATFGDNGVVEADGRSVAYLELLSPGLDTDIYNYMIHFCLSGSLVCGAFNCVAGDRWFWTHIFKLAARSMKFDAKEE